MRRAGSLGVLLAVVLAAVATLVPSAAAAKSSDAKFCNAVSKISSDIESGPDASDADEIKSTASAIKNAAKSAPSAVKSAMNTMARFYASLAGASKSELAGKIATGALNYSKAAGKFAKYYTSHCI